MSLFTRIREAGRRNSAVDMAHIQEAHDHMVMLGAACSKPADTKEAARHMREAEVLRVDDSFDSRIQALRKAAQAMFSTGYGYDSPYCFVRDCFDSDVIIQVGDCLYQIPYEVGVGDDADGDDVKLGEPIEVDIAYIPSDEADETETAGDEIVERKIPQRVRKTLSKGDFAGKNKSFPIQKPEDVKAALQSIGRAGADNYDAATLKRNILRIAKRKGFPIPKSDQKEMDSEKVTEAAALELSSEFVELREGAVAADGSAQVKIIAPGWGSSGYYSPELLRRDGPKVFKKGLHMYWNHQTAQEEAARPEGNLDDLAAELTGDAKWMPNGPTGAGLYAPIRVFETYQAPVNDLAKSIGVSIRAAGRAKEGEAEGRKGTVIDSIESARSIDFVTSPGAGGEILQLFEAARGGRKPHTEEDSMENKQLTEKVNSLEAQNAKLLERIILKEAAEFVAEKLGQAKLHPMTAARLKRELVAAAPIKEGALDTAAFTTAIDEAVKAAIAEASAIAGAGAIRGMGTSATTETQTLEESTKKLQASLQLLGMSEAAAKLAAQGRTR